MVFLVPRSFMSGLYFRRFRARLREALVLERVHLFESRKAAFKADAVLQENVIVRYRKGTVTAGVEISSSPSSDSLEEATVRVVPRSLVERPDDPQGALLVPATEEQEQAVRTVRSWPSSLRAMGLRISTGPVVPFRTDALVDRPEGAVPMLWMQHVQRGQVLWPLGIRKPEYILASAGPRLLIPNATCVLLRRFSAKEESRRLTAAVLHGGALQGDFLGLENHLNYIHRPGGSLSREEATGLAALLSSPLVEAYFRVVNGNTQVNATDIEGMPLPEAGILRRLGEGESLLATGRLRASADP
jgi:adenine-specific DNA-methyltransferase